MTPQSSDQEGWLPSGPQGISFAGRVAPPNCVSPFSSGNSAFGICSGARCWAVLTPSQWTGTGTLLGCAPLCRVSGTAWATLSWVESWFQRSGCSERSTFIRWMEVRARRWRAGAGTHACPAPERLFPALLPTACLLRLRLSYAEACGTALQSVITCRATVGRTAGPRR